ncbi:hypothetical protein PTTG_05578 [Puccinia triticina 1-1 BBBD Race 1]|uniref:Chromo domain-containing protein n=2 Tax=Puccinia triticina TaxID=208348 RepID=A0A180GKN2_PUCT1|nr:uncharacterized protein PtA15_11A50 [Puccinia triticina]OAV93240.1 hypothetical protein PTTG_05578 [Puccinia triticina 1-1 BBBD Race 1]WAQ89363.1 hypothetical protein PtA15_11A50 [Puccinia triticina]WAR59412.1 hypothetical protein PtB15_11B52 [Puccinia triticina]
MTPAASPTPSSIPSDDDTEKSFSGSELPVNQAGRCGSPVSEASGKSYDLDWIEDSKLEASTGGGRLRFYLLKFTGYEEMEWHAEDNVGASELISCYWGHIQHGREACIRAQQRLLQEEAARSDSEDSEVERAGPPKATRSPKLKPRPGADADPDLANSSSEDEVDDDDGRGILTFQLREPKLDNSKTSGNQHALASSSRFRYTPRNPQIRQLLKLAPLQSHPPQHHHPRDPTEEKRVADRRRKEFGRLWNASMAKGIDPTQAAYSYSPATNPERANRVTKHLEELEAVKRSRSRQPRLKVLFRQQGSASIIAGRDTARPDEPETMHGSKTSGPNSGTPLLSPTTRPAPLPHVAPTRDRLSDSATGPQDLRSQPSFGATPPASRSSGPTVPAPMAPNPNDPPHNARTKTPLQPPKDPLNRIQSHQPNIPERLTDAEKEERSNQSHPHLKRKYSEYLHRSHINLSATSTTSNPIMRPFGSTKKTCLRQIPKTVRFC